MSPVGRPRTSTNQGARPPVNQIGVADPFNYGVSLNPATGQVAPWRQFIDTTEDVPELYWPRSVITLDHMRTDSQLAALLTSVMWGISQLRFIVDPNGARPSLIKEISQDLNLPVKGQDDEPLGRMKHRFSHSKFALQALLAVIYGYAYFEQNGDIVDGKWRLRKMFNIMPRTIAQMNVADDGGLVNIVQWAGRSQINGSVPVWGGMTEPIPVDRLTAFVFQQEGYNWHGRSMMRDCFKDWVLKDRLMRVEAVNHERAGGVPYAVAPMGATVPEIEDIAQMMQQFRIGETAGGAVPFGTEIKIAKGTGSEVDRTIQRYDQSMARRFLLMLANLAQGGNAQVGSYALGETFEDFFLVGQRHIAQWYCDTVNEHIIEDIVDWNYGEDEELVPKLTWERTSEDSLGTEQLATLVQRGVIIVDDELENSVRYKYQLPKRKSPRPDEVVGPGIPRQPGELPPGGVAEPAAGDPSGAPSSGTPATPAKPAAKASILRRFSRKPSVMAKADTSGGETFVPVLVTVPNVEILHAGWEYPLSTGYRTFTPEDLRDCVMAANEDPSIPSPRLKIGHIDPRFNGGEFDGSPAFGKATNLRLSENGMSVYADYVGVPKWLADIMPTAYPSRSIEGYDDVPKFGINGMDMYESQTGHKWRFVLSACSLLGIEWPGVTVLEDLPQWYGEEMPDSVIVDPALLQATGGDPMKKFPFPRRAGTAASANLDDVRRSFYDEYCRASPEMSWWWIQAILVDPNELVVEDDETGQLYKIPFSTDAEGMVAFDDADPVRIEYVPDTREANKAAASHVAATLAIGRKVAASWSTREESVPAPATTATGGQMDPKEIRTRLGLAEDATDADVQETLRTLNAAAGVEPTVEVPAAPVVTEPAAAAVTEPAAPAAPVTEVTAPAAVAASGLPDGMVAIDRETLAMLQASGKETSEFISKQRERDREQLVSAAIGDGRIAPKSKDHWLEYLKTDPTGAETLASLQKGLIPVELRGHAPSSATGGAVDPLSELGDDIVGTWTDQLFPEVANARATAARAAEGTARRSRITADSSYARR